MAEPPAPGETFSAEWLPGQDDFDRFAEISGDDNPIHVDPGFSARTRFGRTVSHGMLLYSRLWAMMRARYPGLRQASQTLMFPNPAYAGEAVRFEVTVEAVEGGRATLAVAGHRVADGEAVLLGQAVLVAEAKP